MSDDNNSNEEAMAKKAREFKKIPADHLRKFVKHHDMSHADLGALLGVSDSSVSTWIAKNEAPYWTRVAIEGLQRQGRRVQDEVYVVRVTPDQREQFLSGLTFIGITATKI